MGNKNKKQHQMEALARRDAKIRQLPTIYTFNFKDVPSEVYAKPWRQSFLILSLPMPCATATNWCVPPTAYRRVRLR